MPHRITDRGTFGALVRARRIRRGAVTVAYLPPDGRWPAARVAYAIGRKAGGAVVRNRIRRRLRAACRAHEALLVPGAAYLVSAGAPAASMAYHDLVRDLGEALAAAGRSRP